jgi:hypothetical protein
MGSMNRRCRLSLLLLAPLLLGGCDLITGPDLPPAAFSVAQEAVAVGDTLVATLTNLSAAEPIGFNLCFTALDLRIGTGWREVQPLFGVPPRGICTAQLNVLGPGEEMEARWTVPAGLPAGTYRLRSTTRALEGSARRTVTTRGFRIFPPG